MTHLMCTFGWFEASRKSLANNAWPNIKRTIITHSDIHWTRFLWTGTHNRTLLGQQTIRNNGHCVWFNLIPPPLFIVLISNEMCRECTISDKLWLNEIVGWITIMLDWINKIFVLSHRLSACGEAKAVCCHGITRQFFLALVLIFILPYFFCFNCRDVVILLCIQKTHIFISFVSFVACKNAQQRFQQCWLL